jgi:hypothetical protein
MKLLSPIFLDYDDKHLTSKRQDWTTHYLGLYFPALLPSTYSPPTRFKWKRLILFRPNQFAEHQASYVRSRPWVGVEPFSNMAFQACSSRGILSFQEVCISSVYKLSWAHKNFEQQHLIHSFSVYIHSFLDFSTFLPLYS